MARMKLLIMLALLSSSALACYIERFDYWPSPGLKGEDLNIYARIIKAPTETVSFELYSPLETLVLENPNVSESFKTSFRPDIAGEYNAVFTCPPTSYSFKILVVEKVKGVFPEVPLEIIPIFLFLLLFALKRSPFKP